MTGTALFAPGGYRYIPAVFQYSGGVAAEDGYELERARFMRPVPLASLPERLDGPAPRLAAGFPTPADQIF